MKDILTKFIAIGDSITYGYPYTNEISWVNTLKNHGIYIINRGINGDTLDDMLERLYIDGVDLSPDYMIIMGGTNDAFLGYSLASMKYNIKTIIKICSAEKIHPILGIPIPTTESIVEQKLTVFRNFLIRYCIKNKVPYIDFYNALVDKKGGIAEEYDFDGVHPNKVGYEKMGKVALKTVVEVMYYESKGPCN